MASAFNLTAEINLRGPSNLGRVVADIRRQLSTVSLNLNINPNATRGIQAATGQVQALSAALQTANANATNLAATMRNLGTAISGASNGMNTLAGGLNNVGRQTTNIQRNVGAATSSMEEFGRQSALAVRRFAAFSVATGGIYALVRAISSGYNEFLTFNKELVRLQQVTGATANGLKGITDEITRLATGFGVTSSELLTVSSTLAQAGLTATQTKTALEALAKSALAPSFDNLNDTVEGSIALMRQFGISAGDLESSLGSINAVAAAFAVESGDIIKAIQRTGGVFASASKGVSEGKDALNEFIALFTSVRATTRESAETIATGLRTIFTRVQRGGTIQALKEYGITLTDLEGKFVGPYEAVRRLSEGLKSLDPRDLRFSQIVEELGGFRQIGKVIPLIQQFATAQQALGVAQRGAGSLADAAGTAQLSLANKITKVREEFVALIRDIGQSQSFQTFADISLKLASALISVASAAKEVLPALAALAAIRAIPAIGQFVGGFGRGMTRRHEGGPIRAFASGGYVPGSGNRDTVPAMLTPGEFVIRKKAVQTIGANRLHRMNKYATGGKVQKFAFGGFPDADVSWDEILESIRRKYNLPSNAEIDRMTPAQKKEYEKRLGEIAFTVPGRGRPRKNVVAQKEQKMRKGQLGLFLSAAGMRRGPKAPPEAFQEQLLKYQQAGPMGAAASVKPKFISWGKGQGSFADVIKGSEDMIRSKLSGVQLANFEKLLEKGSLQNYLDSGGKMGHIPPLKKAIYSILGITGKNLGGIVQRFAGGKGVKKIPIEEQITKGMKKGKNYQFGLVGLRSGTKGQFKGKEQFEVTRGKEPNLKTYPVTLFKSTLSNISKNKEEAKIEKDIESGFASMVSSTASTLSSMLKSTKQASAQKMQKILRGSPLTTVVGTVFEAALASLGSPYIDKGEKTKSMDFPLGLGPVASNFGIPSNVPTDATRTIGGSGKGTAQMKNQIKRFIGAVEGNEFTKSFEKMREKKRLEKPSTTNSRDMLGSILSNVPSGKTVADVIGASSASKLMQKYKINKLQLFAGALKGQGAKGTEAIIKKQGGSFSSFVKELQELISSRNNSGGFIQRFAQGGSAEDTVPALLTPGEFVINKKAAQRIGSAKLNRLNKADKISGFNKGGAVGDIQSFAGGGGVQRFFIGGSVQQIFNNLATAINRLIPIFGNLSTTTATVTRNMAAQQAATFRQQGLSGSALKSAMINAGYGPGGINNMRTRNQMNQAATQRAAAGGTGDGGMGMGMGLMFIGPMIAESINSAITSGGGPITQAIGSGITSVISGATIGSAFTSILGPWGIVIGAVAGGASALLNWTKTIQAAETVEKEKIIETKAQSLEKSFERLSKAADDVDIDKIQDSIIADIQAILAAQQTVSANTISAAQPSDFGRMMSYKMDTTALSKDLAQAATVSGTSIQRYIEYAMSKGGNFDELLNKFGDVGKESFAIARGGPELTLLKALAEEARASGKKQDYGGKKLGAAELESKYQERIREINEEFKKAAIEQQEAQKTLNSVTVTVDHFAIAIKKLESVVSRASAEFEEAQRRMDINVGSMFGEEAKIAGPSRLNENILQNPAAYATEEISAAIRDLGQNLQFSPEFTKQLETATISKSTLEAGLPKILAEAAAAQKAAGGGGLAGASETAIRDKLEELFKSVPGMNAGDATEAARKLFESIQDRLESNKDISLSELATNDPALNKIMEGYNNTVDSAAKAQAEYNQMIAQVNSRLNQYVSALERATEAQSQAATVRTEGKNKLTEALGGSLSLSDLNRAFEDSLLTLTSRIGGNGMAIAGTGTTDADAISRRLQIESERLKTLQTQKAPAAGTAAFDKYNKDLANATLSVRNLTKAQEKLANDTTRASNALSKIQSIRQAQESRRGTFDDILRNLNNPEWMMQFVRQVESLQRVQAGGGNIRDIAPALDALQQRLAGMADPGEREAERTKFYDNIARILERSGMNRGDIDAAMRLIGNRGQEPELKTAIDQYEEAIKQQATAIENGANLTRTAAQDFYTEIMRGATDFVNRIGQAGVLPVAPAGGVATGGLIYASKGQLVNFKPKGTDTVPAMLTPGEFVVNARATKKNMGLLRAINGGAKGYSKGGVVYLDDGGVPGAYDPSKDPYTAFDKNLLRSTYTELKQYTTPEKSKKQLRQSSSSGPYPLIKKIGVILKQIKTTPDGFNSDGWRNIVNDISNVRSDQVASWSSDTFIKYVKDRIGQSVEGAMKIRAPVSSKPLIPSVFPGGANQTFSPNPVDPGFGPVLGKPASWMPANLPPTNPAILDQLNSMVIQGPSGGVGASVAGLTTPQYYDELTYKEWLDRLIEMSWAKFEAGKYDQMPGPLPPDQARFVTSALYYDKEAKLTEEQKAEKQKAEQQLEQWKSDYEDWKNGILKRRQDFANANKKYEPSPEEKYLDDFQGWVSNYRAAGKDPAEIEKVFTTAKFTPSFPARSTAYDTRYTGGIAGVPRQKSAPMLPGLMTDEMLALTTGVKTETETAQKEYLAYLAKKNGPQPQTKEDADIQQKSLEIATEAYRDAIDNLNQLATQTNVFRHQAYQSFETGTGKALRVPTVMYNLRELSTQLRADKLIDPPIDDSIIDSYYANRARIVEQNAPTELVDPKRPELGTKLPEEPLKAKDSISLTASERKTIRGAKGTLSQYKSSLSYYKVQRGKYNRQLMLAQRKLAYNKEQQRRRDEFNSPERGRPAPGMATGGMVYASQGQLINYQPRGTDTVPAMLTPGEFVVNKRATKQNIGLLRSINDNKNKAPINFMNKGGIIQPNYYQRGSVAANNNSSGGGVSVSLDTSSLNQAFAKFDQSIQSFGGIADRFNGVASAISESLGGLSGVKQAFDAIAGATTLLSGTASGFSSAIGDFNSAVTRLSSSIGDIPDSISLRVSGSIPVNVTVTVNGGEGLEDKLEPFKKEILNEVSSKLNSATNGRLRVDFFTSTN